MKISRFRSRIKKTAKEIKMPQKIVFAGNCEIKMHKKITIRKNINWNDDFGF